jgi:hypothetical protein
MQRQISRRHRANLLEVIPIDRRFQFADFSERFDMRL